MGLFKHKKNAIHSTSTTAPPPPSAVLSRTTFHITQSLSGTLTVTPNNDSHHKYTIVLTRPDKARHDSIDICVRRQDDESTVGHCLIQVTTGKFLDCHLGSNTASDDVQLKHTGHGSAAKYALSVPSLALPQQQQQQQQGLQWVHDEGTMHGAMVNADRRFRLENDNEVLARFAGSSGGVSEFGMLEVYPSSLDDDMQPKVDWCGLLVLTAVSVYAREERHREKKGKTKSKLEGVGLVGDLLGIATGTGI